MDGHHGGEDLIGEALAAPEGVLLRQDDQPLAPPGQEVQFKKKNIF